MLSSDSKCCSRYKKGHTVPTFIDPADIWSAHSRRPTCSSLTSPALLLFFWLRPLPQQMPFRRRVSRTSTRRHLHRQWDSQRAERAARSSRETRSHECVSVRSSGYPLGAYPSYYYGSLSTIERDFYHTCSTRSDPHLTNTTLQDQLASCVLAYRNGADDWDGSACGSFQMFKGRRNGYQDANDCFDACSECVLDSVYDGYTSVQCNDVANFDECWMGFQPQAALANANAAAPSSNR